MDIAHEEADEAEDEAESDGDGFDRTQFLLRDFLGEFTVSGLDGTEEEPRMAEGTAVVASASHQIALREGDAQSWLGLATGDRITLSFAREGEEAEERTVTISGIFAKEEKGKIQINMSSDTTATASDDVVPEGAVPSPTPFILDLEEGRIHETIKTLSENPGVFVLEVALINKMLTGLFEKLTALPLVVAILSLFAAGVIIANTVSLAVLERRREIGIMKAIGLQSSDVLHLLLLENGLVGLAGGVLGCGVGVGAIVLMGVLSESPGSFPYLTLLALVALAVAIALGATLLTAWGASREKPLIVLRYE